MAFLGGLALLGSAGEHMQKTRALQLREEIAQSNAAFKEQALMLREMQLQHMMERTTHAQQTSQGLADFASDPTVQAALSGGGDAPDPASALAATPTPSPQAPTSGLPAAAAGPSAGAPPPMAGAGQPQMAQIAGIPGGPPTPGGIAPAGPQGEPSFGPAFMQNAQFQPGKPPMLPPAQQAQAQQPPQQAPARPTMPGGKPIYDRASPEDVKRLGGGQPQQQPAAQQVAQAGQPQPQPQPQAGQQQQGAQRKDLNDTQIMGIVKNIAAKKGITDPAQIDKQFQAAKKYYDGERAKQDIHDVRQLGMEQKKEAAQQRREKIQQEKDTIKGTAEGIIAGDLPPDLRGIIHLKAPIEAYIHEHGGGVKLTDRMLQWQRAGWMAHSLSSQRATAFFNLSETVNTTIERTKENAKKLGLSNYPDFNTWEKEYYTRVKDQKTPEAKIANQFYEDVGALKDEMAQLVGGTYAPTESAWKIAHELVNENWSYPQLEARLDEAKRIINIRANALAEMGGKVMTEPNPYMGGGGQVRTQQDPTQQQQAPLIPDSAVKALQDGKPHKFNTPQGEQIWQLKDGKPERVSQ